jgi:hypothetical protein
MIGALDFLIARPFRAAAVSSSRAGCRGTPRPFTGFEQSVQNNSRFKA